LLSHPFRLLLITDTHGDVASIDDAIRAHGADACIHCGDFGFYDAASPERLPTRELRLRVRHSGAPAEVRSRARSMSREEAIGVVRELGLMAGFLPYLEGRRSFAAPVWAVWGNHEDAEVVRSLQRGSARVGNLTLLDERGCVEPWPGVRVVGIGGNFLPEGDDFLAPDWTAPAGQLLASWPQWARLLAAEGDRPRAERTILVTHVSPAKARLLERVAPSMGVWLSVSGHMGSPFPRNYSLFTVAEPDEALERSSAAVERLRSRCAASRRPWVPCATSSPPRPSTTSPPARWNPCARWRTSTPTPPRPSRRLSFASWRTRAPSPTHAPKRSAS